MFYMYDSTACTEFLPMFNVVTFGPSASRKVSRQSSTDTIQSIQFLLFSSAGDIFTLFTTLWHFNCSLFLTLKIPWLHYAVLVSINFSLQKSLLIDQI